MYMYTGIHTNKFMKKRLGVLVAVVTRKKRNRRRSKESLSTTSIHVFYV